MHRAGGETGGRDGGLPLWGEHTHASHEHHHTDKVSLQQVTPRICLGRTGSQRRHLTVVPRDAPSRLFLCCIRHGPQQSNRHSEVGVAGCWMRMS